VAPEVEPVASARQHGKRKAAVFKVLKRLGINRCERFFGVMPPVQTNTTSLLLHLTGGA
jgi:hypothetical protein